MNGEELQFFPAGAEGAAAVSIAYRFLKPQAGKPTFVWFCGFRSEMESEKASALARWARQSGAGCLRFDYSGHGKSGGRFEDGTVSTWLAEAAAVYRHALCAGPAVFAGSSMGGWIALLLARQLMAEVPQAWRGNFSSSPSSPPGVMGELAPHLEGLVLIAPAWNMTDLFWDRAPEEARQSILRDGVYYRPSAYSQEPYPITKALIEDGKRHRLGDGSLPLAMPVRILQGYLDPDVPWRHSLGLLGLIAGPGVRLTLVKDGEHRLSRPQDLALLFATLSEFLEVRAPAHLLG